MMQRKTVTLLIAFGPEIRSFIYSGLLDRLQDDYIVQIVTFYPNSKALQEIDTVPRVQMPPTAMGSFLSLIHTMANQKTQFRLLTKGKQIWKHYLQPDTKGEYNVRWRSKLRGFLLKRKFWSNFPLEYIEQQAAKHFGTASDWRILFQQLQTDALILSTYNHPRILPAVQTARNMKIKLFYVTNSWKDVYTTPYISVMPEKIVVNENFTANEIRTSMPELRDSVAVNTSLHLAKLLSPTTIYPTKEAFCISNGLDPARPLINYTAAAPAAVCNEEAVVELLLEAIKDGRFSSQPQVLLRLNPMEDGTRFLKLSSNFKGYLVIQRPKWEWIPHQDWCCALPSDIDEWLGTIFHSDMNISVPSTVTMEYLSLSKRIVNIVFDARPVGEAVSNRRFWDAPFYESVRHHPLVTPAYSADEMLTFIEHQLDSVGHSKVELDPKLFPTTDPVEYLTQLVADALK